MEGDLIWSRGSEQGIESLSASFFQMQRKGSDESTHIDIGDWIFLRSLAYK